MKVQVAIAVIINENNQVLITKRGADQHQGNKWEFPGGKIEVAETAQQALARELKEELGIQLQSATFLTTIAHAYPTKNITFEVYKVTKWQGEPKGLEGQPMRWVEKVALKDYKFPAANAEILSIIEET